ncbi:MAG: transcriptional repressor [Aquihabitans sp.]
MDEELASAVRTRLASTDQRFTAGRQALVTTLLGAGRPLTAAEVLEASGLAQSSAYRNLTLLESCGVVHRLSSTDEFARFELAHDLTDHHHHHLICTACGSVADFTASDGLEQSLADAMRVVNDALDFHAVDHRLDLLGLCADCH